MKLGTENKTKTVIAAGLLILAAVLLFQAFHGNGDRIPISSRRQRAAQRRQSPGRRSGSKDQTAHKDQRMLLAQSLDPTLRFDLLKCSEDVTYKGTGRDIFHSQARQPRFPSRCRRASSPSRPPHRLRRRPLT